MPIFPFRSPQTAHFWSYRGFEWKAVNKEMVSFPSASCLCVCQNTLQYRRVRRKLLHHSVPETGYYLPVSPGILQLMECALPSSYQAVMETERIFQDLFKVDGR